MTESPLDTDRKRRGVAALRSGGSKCPRKEACRAPCCSAAALTGSCGGADEDILSQGDTLTFAILEEPVVVERVEEPLPHEPDLVVLVEKSK